MRDTLIGAALITAIVAAFWFFQKSGDSTLVGLPQPVATPVAASAATAAPQQIATTPSAKQTLAKRKGIRDESKRPKQSEELARLGNDEAKSERSAPEPQQDQSLPDLYSRAGEGPKKSEGVTKTWHGVPVTAWLDSRRSALPRAPVTGEAPSDIRFFFQCMELKKDGPREVAERECRKLRAGLPKDDELARRGGAPSTLY